MISGLTTLDTWQQLWNKSRISNSCCWIEAACCVSSPQQKHWTVNVIRKLLDGSINVQAAYVDPRADDNWLFFFKTLHLIKLNIISNSDGADRSRLALKARETSNPSSLLMPVCMHDISNKFYNFLIIGLFFQYVSLLRPPLTDSAAPGNEPIDKQEWKQVITKYEQSFFTKLRRHIIESKLQVSFTFSAIRDGEFSQLYFQI